MLFDSDQVTDFKEQESKKDAEAANHSKEEENFLMQKMIDNTQATVKSMNN